MEKHDLGLKAAIAGAAIPRSAYVFIPASEARKDVEALLSVFLEIAPNPSGESSATTPSMPERTDPRKVVKKAPHAAAALGAVVLVPSLGGDGTARGFGIILPSPSRVLKAAVELFPTRRFLQALAATFGRGMLSFAISLPAGVVVGLASGLSPAFRAVVSPALTVIRATPVLALILILLIWLPSWAVPVFAAVLMAFPVIVSDVQQGVLSVDSGLLEMARLFRLRRRDLVWSVYAPSVAPYLESSAYATLGLVWKVVVAGEVLSQPAKALGTGCRAPGCIWRPRRSSLGAAAGIFLCALSDAALRSSRPERNGMRYVLDRIGKSFDSLRVLDGFSLEFPRGR